MKVFATLLILTCASKVHAGAIGAGGEPGDESLKSIKTTILSKDGILGEIFGAGGVRRRRGRLLDMLGGGGGFMLERPLSSLKVEPEISRSACSAASSIAGTTRCPWPSGSI